MPCKTKKKQSRSPARTKKGPLTLDDVLANDRLRTIWQDLRGTIPVAETAEKLGITEQAVTELRAKINEATKRDPEIARLRSDSLRLYPVYDAGMVKNMKAGDPRSLIAWGQGVGILQPKSYLEISGKLSLEEIARRRKEKLAAGLDKFKEE